MGFKKLNKHCAVLQWNYHLNKIMGLPWLSSKVVFLLACVMVDSLWKAGHVAVAGAGDLAGFCGWPRASRNCEGH